MAIPIDTALYERAKKIVNKQYKKHSAYRSGMYVQTYKRLGGKYRDDKPGKRSKASKRSKRHIDQYPLRRWFLEKWKDVNPNKTKRSYPVYRPTVRVSKRTPKTLKELSKSRLRQQSKLKQKIKGSKNLPKF